MAIKNWTLPIPAVPPPAAGGHENPGKRKSENFGLNEVNYQNKYMAL
jgi:hypothetical protein